MGPHVGSLPVGKALGLTICRIVPSPVAETLAVMLLVGDARVRCRPTEGMAGGRFRCPGRGLAPGAGSAAPEPGRCRGQEPRPDDRLSRRGPGPGGYVRPLRPVRSRWDLDGDRLSRPARQAPGAGFRGRERGYRRAQPRRDGLCCSPRSCSRRWHGSGCGPSRTLMPAPTSRTRPRCSCPSRTSPTSWPSGPAG